MEVRVLYLDIDDEITTAASRVRASDGTRVALVLPNGSRVATSRINFRLLARDATLNGKGLSIVASDPATRALAASAGLPIFGSVSEYEGAIALERSQKGGDEPPSGEVATGAAAGAALGTAAATAAVAGAAGAVTAGAGSGVAKAGDRASHSPRGPGGRKPRGAASTSDDTISTTVPTADDRATATSPGGAGAAMGAAAAIGAGSAAAAAPIVSPAGVGVPPLPAMAQMGAAGAAAAHRQPAAVPAARVVADTPVEPLAPPIRTAGSRVAAPSPGRSWGSERMRTPIVIGGVVLLLALLVGGVGAYLFLPTATAVIAPRETTIGPVPLTIVASTTATEPDPAARTVPAVTKTVPVEASQTFEVKGKRVEETNAKGTVRFRNKDFTRSNTIPKGSIVSTQGGVRFRTDRSVTVDRAQLVGLQIFPASATVKVTAVGGGPAGNVEPNTILVIPRGEDPLTLDVTNPDATSGGKRDEFPKVVQADIDAATKALDAQLAASFADQVADPALTQDGTTVFPETAVLGESTYDPDPKTLLGDEVETFHLSATASGTVLAVDEAAVKAVAEANIAPHVQTGYELVDGSGQVDASAGQVENGVITFPATITAQQVLQIDPVAIETEIRGKSLAEAEAILNGYGTSQLTVWPDWVSTIPTLDARVDVQTAAPAAP